MEVLLFLLCIQNALGQLVLPPGISPSFEAPSDPCRDIKNKSLIEMPKHKYMVVEHCLYYSLQRQVDAKAKQPNAIALLPPRNSEDDTTNITVNVHGITLQSIWLNEMLKDLRVRGFMSVSWRDPRLTWDPKEWKLEQMNVQTAAHVWVPQLSSDKHESALASGDIIDYKRIRLTNEGNITAMMVFNLQTFCDVDFHNFPSDVHDCCAQLEPTFYDNLIDFRIVSQQYHVDDRFLKNTGYRIDDVNVKTLSTTDGSSACRFCVRLSRSNTTLHVELAVPMAICAVLILFAPLFGSFKTQLHVKLFALLLQYLCLQFLANKMTYLGSGTTPKIFRFYEFTIVMNLVSLLLTLFVAAADRIERTLPPAQGILHASLVVNKFCFCLSVVDQNEDTTRAEEKKYARDWRCVFSAVHGVAMTLVVIVYLIGVGVIYN